MLIVFLWKILIDIISQNDMENFLLNCEKLWLFIGSIFTTEESFIKKGTIKLFLIENKKKLVIKFFDTYETTE